VERIGREQEGGGAISGVGRVEDVWSRMWPRVSTGWRRQLEGLVRPSQERRQQIETQIWFVYWPEPSRSSPAEGAEEANASPTIFWATSSLEAAVRVMRQRGLQHCTPWTPLGEMEMTRAAIAAAYLYEYIDPGEGRVKEFTRRVVIRTAAPEIPRRLVVQGARRQRDPARPGDPDLLLSERDTVVDLHAPDASAQVDAALERIVRNGWDLYEVTW